MHDVISAFLDNEPFDAQELSATLATSEGRDLLIDLVALRGADARDERGAFAEARRYLQDFSPAAALEWVDFTTGERLPVPRSVAAASWSEKSSRFGRPRSRTKPASSIASLTNTSPKSSNCGTPAARAAARILGTQRRKNSVSTCRAVSMRKPSTR